MAVCKANNIRNPHPRVPLLEGPLFPKMPLRCVLFDSANSKPADCRSQKTQHPAFGLAEHADDGLALLRGKNTNSSMRDRDSADGVAFFQSAGNVSNLDGSNNKSLRPEGGNLEGPNEETSGFGDAVFDTRFAFDDEVDDIALLRAGALDQAPPTVTLTTEAAVAGVNNEIGSNNGNRSGARGFAGGNAFFGTISPSWACGGLDENDFAFLRPEHASANATVGSAAFAGTRESGSGTTVALSSSREEVLYRPSTPTREFDELVMIRGKEADNDACDCVRPVDGKESMLRKVSEDEDKVDEKEKKRGHEKNVFADEITEARAGVDVSLSPAPEVESIRRGDATVGSCKRKRRDTWLTGPWCVLELPRYSASRWVLERSPTGNTCGPTQDPARMLWKELREEALKMLRSV